MITNYTLDFFLSHFNPVLILRTFFFEVNFFIFLFRVWTCPPSDLIIQFPKGSLECLCLVSPYVLDVLLLWINPLNAKLNPICHFLPLLGAHHILHVSRIRVKLASIWSMLRCLDGGSVLLFCVTERNFFSC